MTRPHTFSISTLAKLRVDMLKEPKEKTTATTRFSAGFQTSPFANAHYDHAALSLRSGHLTASASLSDILLAPYFMVIFI